MKIYYPLLLIEALILLIVVQLLEVSVMEFFSAVRQLAAECPVSWYCIGNG